MTVLIFQFKFLGPLLAGKWVWPPCASLMIWGLQTQPKSWPTGWTFWANHYLEIIFSKFSGVNSPPPLASVIFVACFYFRGFNSNYNIHTASKSQESKDSNIKPMMHTYTQLFASKGLTPSYLYLKWGLFDFGGGHIFLIL